MKKLFTVLLILSAILFYFSKWIFPTGISLLLDGTNSFMDIAIRIVGICIIACIIIIFEKNEIDSTLMAALLNALGALFILSLVFCVMYNPAAAKHTDRYSFLYSIFFLLFSSFVGGIFYRIRKNRERKSVKVE